VRDLAKNCAIAWSILCAAWAAYGFFAGAVAEGNAGVALCCGSMSTLSAGVVWIIGLVPCALIAVIGGPRVQPGPATSSEPTESPKIPDDEPKSVRNRTNDSEENMLLGLIVVIVLLWVIYQFSKDVFGPAWR